MTSRRLSFTLAALLAAGCSATESKSVLDVYQSAPAGVTGRPAAAEHRYRASEIRYDSAIPVRNGPETIRVFEYQGVDPDDPRVWRDGRWLVVEVRESEWVRRWEDRR